MTEHVHLDYTAHDDCANLEDSYGMICVRCGKCGRLFDEHGSLTQLAPHETVDGRPVKEDGK